MKLGDSMKSKILFISVVILSIVACGTTYFGYNAYSKYSDVKNTNNNLTNVEIDRTSQDVPASERYATEYVEPELSLTDKEVNDYAQSDTEYPSKMTMELFKLLKPNMTYEEVKALTNLEGTLDPTMSTSDGIESYEYKGTGYSRPTLVYFDGKLASTSQAGLIRTPALSIEGYGKLVKGMSLSEVISILGEGEYTGFMSSPNNPEITGYTYKLNHHYIDLQFSDGYLYEVPTLPTN